MRAALRWLNNHPLAWLVPAAALSLLLYLALSGWSFGFPLDDGWIHQTYARNLAETGRLEYTPGVVSAGSTSPLWTLWLALGYLIGAPYQLWTHGTGVLLLAGCGWLVMQLWRQLDPETGRHAWLPGLLVVTSWPLVWAAGSGMEILLFVVLALALVKSYWQQLAADTGWQTVAGMGLLSGLLVLTRPDGLVLLLLVLGGIALASDRRGWWKPLLYVGASLLPLLPYFAFNLQFGDTLWPNTMAAKQTEYSFLLEERIVGRVFRLLFFSLGGPESGLLGMSAGHLLLLPGVIASGWGALRQDIAARRLALTLPLWWAGGHVLLYAWKLPVLYQHGRYLLVVLPVWLLFGLHGWVRIMYRLRNAKLGSLRLGWMLRQVGIVAFGIVWSYFLLLGGQQYGQDVRFIDGEMVAMGYWLAEQTPPDALIAAHDIGAIGYFAGRSILDLAGLISPEVVPWLDDEARMSSYILESDADFLVTAPGWSYQQAVSEGDLTPLFSTDFAWTRQQGLNNMTVYALP